MASHEQMMAGYAVACRFGVLEARAFELAELMFRAMTTHGTGVDEAWVTKALRLIDAYKTAPGSKTEATADAMIAHLRTVNAGVDLPDGAQR